MMSHTIGVAVRSVRRSPVMSGLMVLGLALGIGTYVTAYGSLRAFGDAAPEGLPGVVHVEIDRHYRAPPPLEAERMFAFALRANLLLSWKDAAAIDRGEGPPIARMFDSRAQLASGSVRRESIVRFATAPFFELFALPIAGAPFGSTPDGVWVEASLVSSWSEAQLRVGGTMTIEGVPHTIAGIVALDRRHAPLFELPWYSEPGVFVPIERFERLRAPPVDRIAWGADLPSFAAVLASDDPFVHVWARAESPADRAAIEARTASVAAAYPGRTARLRPLADWHARTTTPHPAFSLFEVFSVVALIAAVFGLSRLLLAQFAARRAEVGLRRALGASPVTIFAEHLCEAGLIGLAGGVVGIGLGALGMKWMTSVLPFETVQFQLSWAHALRGIVVGVLASLFAASLPAWRAVSTPPARAMGRW